MLHFKISQAIKPRNNTEYIQVNMDLLFTLKICLNQGDDMKMILSSAYPT